MTLAKRVQLVAMFLSVRLGADNCRLGLWMSRVNPGGVARCNPLFAFFPMQQNKRIFDAKYSMLESEPGPGSLHVEPNSGKHTEGVMLVKSTAQCEN